ncbi:hypothetical protein NVP1264O_42 [Vibrio phage 1.264.O._10N.286.51.F2]|nr:hypothetical protein NVP1264O_42 [Vibrio phage 1.264.O._10N.286.51.F2]
MTNATILSNEMPTTGQFIAVHKFAGDTWARTYRHTVDGVEAYELHATDEWSPIGMSLAEMLDGSEVVGYLGLES